jgi:ATP/maltotriose-dependent transcriptional regulator MalT
MGTSQEYWKESFVNALEAALALGDTAVAHELLGLINELLPGRRTQFLQAQSFRFRAQLAALAGEADAERLAKHAAGLFRELAMPFYLAVTQLEHAEWLMAQGRRDETDPLVTEARETFEQLEAAPWLERVRAIGAERVVA